MRPLDRIVFPPELGGDHHLALVGFQRFAHQLFVGERPIHFRSVEEGDAVVDCRVKEIDHFLFVGRRVAKAHPHAAQPESRDFQTAISKFSCLHFLDPFFSNL